MNRESITQDRWLLPVVIAAHIFLILLIGMAPGRTNRETEYRQSAAITSVVQSSSADRAMGR